MHAFRSLSIKKTCAIITSLAIIGLTYPLWNSLTDFFHDNSATTAWLRNVTLHHRYLAYATYILIIMAVVVLSMPFLIPTIIMAGVIFDFWEAALLVTTGRLLAAATCFALTRYFLHFAEGLQRKAWCAKICRKMRQHGGSYLIMLRILPMVPESVVNYGMGITPISWKKYISLSLVGMLPITLGTLYVGNSLSLLTSWSYWQHILPKPEISAFVITSIIVFYVSLRLLFKPVYNPILQQMPIGAAAYRKQLMSSHLV